MRRDLPSLPIPAELLFELWLDERRGELARTFVPLEKRQGGYVDVEELAVYTGLSEKTLRREIEEKALPVRRVRSRLIIAVSDAKAWLSARREG